MVYSTWRQSQNQQRVVYLYHCLACSSRRCQINEEKPLPCVMLFSGAGCPFQECAPADLDQALTSLGARSAANKLNKPNRDLGANGMPSATAVDDIDFTGGGGQSGRPGFIPQSDDRGRTTGDFLPDLVDKPGDDMDDKKRR